MNDVFTVCTQLRDEIVAWDLAPGAHLNAEFADGDPEELIARLDALIDGAAGNPYLGEAIGALRGQLRWLRLAARRNAWRCRSTSTTACAP